MFRPFQLISCALALALFPLLSHASFVYTAALTGPSESPPNASPGIGFVTVTIDSALHTLEVNVTFSGLTSVTTASHIHSATASPGTGTAIVATQLPSFTGFPLGVTSGAYDATFNTLLDAFYSPAFETAHGGTAATAEAALFASLNDGTAYYNIHTTNSPGGEIRGFLAPAASSATPLPNAALSGSLAITASFLLLARRKFSSRFA